MPVSFFPLARPRKDDCRMRFLRSFLALSVALSPLTPALTAQAAPAARPTRQFATVTVDGTITAGEYGDHTNGQNRGNSGSQAWYVTWDDTNLYVGVDVANRTEAAVIYIDANPLTPVNGGTNANGNLSGQAYDSTNFASLPFRADFVTYIKDSYREYRTANGSGGWSGPTSGYGSYADDGTDTREVAIPWAAITGAGRPASFAWFGYVTSGGGFVYAQVPTGNPAGTIGTAAVANHFFAVANTNTGTSTKPFARLGYAQNFDTLATSGITNTWANYTTLPGWTAVRANGVLTTYRADNGGSTTGALYSYGITATAERALGALGSGTSGAHWYGYRFTNTTASAIESFDVSFIGEQWRNGGNSSPQPLDFAYRVNATDPISVGTWVDVDTLDFISPIATSTAAALDGNDPANRVTLSNRITVTVSPGSSIVFRFLDINDAGNDHGLAVDSFTVIANPQTPLADLGLSKAGPASAFAGETLTYTLVLSNSGNTPATATLLTDTLPAEASFITYTASAPASFTQSGPTLVWDFGTLADGSTLTVTLTASAALTFTSAAILTNTAQASTTANETALGNNTAQASTTITPLLADLQITAASAPTAITLGEALTYTLNVSNTGLTGTTGVQAVLTLDPTTYDLASASGTGGFSAVHTSGLVTFTGDLAVNALETLTVVITPTATGAYTGSASIDPANAVLESNETNNTAAPAVSSVNALAADLTVTVTDTPDPVTTGDRLTYTLNVSNNGGTDALGVTLAFTLPAEAFDFAEATGAWSVTYASGVLTFTGDVTANTNLLLYAAITPTASGVYTTGVAVVDALDTIAESDESNNTAAPITTTVNPVFPDLTVTVTDAPDPVVVNDTLTYTLVAENLGQASANNVDLTFALPVNAVFVGTTSMGGFSAVQVGGVVTFSAPTFAAGAVATLTVSVAPTATGTLTGGPAVMDPQNTVTESDESNNTAAALTTTVQAGWDGAGAVSLFNGAGPAQGWPIFQRNLSSTVQVNFTGVVSPLGQASITFPAGWDMSAATAILSGSGLSGGSAVIVGQVVSLTGLALTNANTGTLTLVGVTTPNPTALTDDGIYTPTVRTARANGILTPIASQPRLNVTIPITNLRDVDANFLPLDSGKVVAIEGVNTALTTFSTGQLNVFVQDDTSGYGVFSATAPISLMTYGNRYIVRGTVSHFNGSFQLSPATAIITTEVGAVVPEPVTYTIQQLRTFSETLEGTLVRVISATKVSGTWPGTGSNADIIITDPTGFTITLRIDLDTDIDGSSEPFYPIEVVGILSQFDSSNPRDSGYQILPRATSDITSTGAPPPVVGFTPVYSIQGPGLVSPFSGTIVTTVGEVVGDFQGTSGQNGFYIQDRTGDGDPLTSDGLFIYIPTANPLSSVNVNVGDWVTVTGRVAEFGTTTQLDLVSALTVTAGSPTITPTIVTLPESFNGELERYEGMLIHIPHSMTVQQNYFLGRYGQLTLASGGRLYQPTNVVTPGAPANALADANLRRLIILDDGWTGQNPATVPYLAGDNTIRAGDTITGLTGVLDAGLINPNGATEYRLQPTLPLTSYVFTRSNPRTLTPEPVAGDNLTIGSFNVLNYFNGNGDGTGFPTSRGASSFTEFLRQNQKLITAVLSLNADVLGLMEMENDGNTARPALHELVDRINTVAGSTVYTYVVNPGLVGTDEIRVAFIYKPGVVTPFGASVIDTNPIHSRPPVAQTFTHIGSGEKFTVIVNHFKSKRCDGATGLDLDQGDGQSCFNATRVLQAQALITFAASLAVTDTDILIIGDLNSYSREDPIATLRNAGFVDLIDTFVDTPYSFVFDGQAGYLDHALASPSFAAQALYAQEWHINADEPLVLDYNTEFNPPALFFPDAFRSSDHDPVLAHFFLSNAPIPNPAVVLTKTVSADLCASQGEVLTVTAGATVNYCFTVENTGDVTLTTHTLVDPMLGVDTTFSLTLTPGMVVGPLPFTYTASMTGTFTNTATFTATDGVNTASDSDSAVLVVQPAFVPAPSIAFTKTVSVDGCVTQADTLTVTVGTAVGYCFTWTNTGNVTFTNHVLTDTALGPNQLFTLSLAPGETFGPFEIAYTSALTGTNPVTMVNTATFSSTNGTHSASASDSATLVILPRYLYLPTIRR